MEEVLMPIKKENLTYNDYLNGISKLKPDEQLNLIEVISSGLKRHMDRKKHSLLELEGLGADAWKGMDAQEYVDRERAAWD